MERVKMKEKINKIMELIHDSGFVDDDDIEIKTRSLRFILDKVLIETKKGLLEELKAKADSIHVISPECISYQDLNTFFYVLERVQNIYEEEDKLLSI